MAGDGADESRDGRLQRLAVLLGKAGLPVLHLTASGAELVVALAGDGGRSLRVLVTPVMPGRPAGFHTAMRAYRFEPADLSRAERARVELLRNILVRLEDRLPADWGPVPVRYAPALPANAMPSPPEGVVVGPAPGEGGPPPAVLPALSEPGAPRPAALAAWVAACRAAGTPVVLVLPLTADRIADWRPVLELVERLEVRHRAEHSLVFAWPDPEDSGGVPVPLEAEASFPPSIRALLGDRIPVRSAVGEPLCRFSRVLQDVLLRASPRASRSRGEGVFGPACQTCALRPTCGGTTTAAARVFGLDVLRPFSQPPWAAQAATAPRQAPWDHKLWWLLADRPDVAVALRDVIPLDQIPDLACVLPWTRLELHEGGSHGPCCADYLHEPGRAPADARPADLWQGTLMRAVRRAMADGEPGRTCRPTCPIWTGGTDLPGDLVLRGGPSTAVLTRIQRVRDLVAVREEPRTPPATICFSATSWCNYDCLMCDCGERGTLDDQPDPAFYEQMAAWALGDLELETNGGEPLAAPRFLAFLDRLAAEPSPRPSVGIVTNGALLTPDRMDRWASILRGIVFSLNAATPGTYLDVNRGVPWPRVRAHLDHVLRLRAQGRYLGGLTYSMVVLRRNLEEVPEFVDLTLRDQVDARFLLQIGNRNDQSVATDPDLAARAVVLLREAARRLREAGRDRPASGAQSLVRVLSDRMSRDDFRPL